MPRDDFTTHDNAEVRAAYHQGLIDGEAQALPFHGVGGARFATNKPQLVAAADYESAVIEETARVSRELQWARADEHRATEGLLHDARRALSEREGRMPDPDAAAVRRLIDRVANQIALPEKRHLELAENERTECASRRSQLESLQTELERELEKVQTWLDDQLAFAEEYASQRPARRRERRLPASVRHYPSVDEFVEEDGRRALPWRDAGGTDYGSRWEWELPDTPWVRTHWRISWLPETGEIYARRMSMAHGKRDEDLGVLLLGRVPHRPGLHRDFLDELHTTMHERNSLVAVAEAVVAEAARAPSTISDSTRELVTKSRTALEAEVQRAWHLIDPDARAEDGESIDQHIKRLERALECLRPLERGPPSER